jgi:hypothetical protein
VRPRIALDATLGRADAYEVDWAMDPLAPPGPTDRRVMDRHDPWYRLLAERTQRQRPFVIRGSAASFPVVRRLFGGEGPDRPGVTLTPCPTQAPLMRPLGLPPALTVRVVRLRRSPGEGEVRVTSLGDAAADPTTDGLDLSHGRWGVETC